MHINCHEIIIDIFYPETSNVLFIMKITLYTGFTAVFIAVEFLLKMFNIPSVAKEMIEC